MKPTEPDNDTVYPEGIRMKPYRKWHSRGTLSDFHWASLHFMFTCNPHI